MRAAAALTRLYRRAGHAAIRAIHAAISGHWLQHRAAGSAFV